MKKVIALTLIMLAYPAYAAMISKLPRSNSEQSGSPPTSATTYDRDCAGNGKPRGLTATIVTVASGVGSVVTITELDGTSGVACTNTWKSTVDTSVAGTTSTTCSQLQ